MESARGTSLSWSGILGGAAVAVGAGWMGELLGGWLALTGPGAEAGSSTGPFLWLLFLCAGSLAGGWIAGRRSREVIAEGPRARSTRDRMEGVLHGIVVWGVLGVFGSLTFAILGGNVALVTGMSGAAMQTGFAAAFFALLLALPLSAIGGGLGASRGRERRRIVVRPPREDVERARAQREPSPPVEARTHAIEVDTTEGDHRHDVYREGVSYPEGEGPGRPPVH